MIKLYHSLRRCLPFLLIGGMIAAGLALPPSVHGQTTGTIYGTVLDQNGAGIPGATVTVTNIEKNITRKSTTESDGSYNFSLLPVGTYSVSVQAGGFKPYKQEGLELVVQANLRSDIKLEVGTVSEQVSITTQAPQVDTASSTLGEVVGAQQIEDLPLNGRNFLQLGDLQAGVNPPVPGINALGSGTNFTVGGTAVSFSVNGMRTTSNNYLLDGVNNVEPFSGTAMIVPSVDAIQEFKILTNMYSAEFGRGGGSIVTILTKSGSNDFHGSAYEFLRNDYFDARNFFAPTVPALKQNQFGATFGGRLIKDRTFFFVSYEGFRNRQGIPELTGVPSLLEREGNFSQAAVKPNEPFSSTPFPGGIIPPGDINPVSEKVLQEWPLPNLGTDTWTGAPAQSNDRDQFDVRVDHTLIQGKNTISARYIFDQGSLLQPISNNSVENLAIVQVPGFGQSSPNRFQNLALSDTNIFSPTLLNEFRFSFGRDRLDNGVPQNNTPPSAFGFTYPITSPIPAPPGIAVPGFSALGYNFYNTYTDNIYEFVDNVSFTHGNHQLQFGADIRHTSVASVFPSIAFGGFGFTGAVTGNGFADFLLGDPLLFLQAGGKDNKSVYQTAEYFYGQDTYHVSRNLTLNLGLRWEISPGFTDPQNLEMTYVPGEHSVLSPTLPTGLVRPGDPGVPNTIFNTSYHNFAPRIGLAWDPFGDGKTSVRAGYGVFYDDSSLLQIAAVEMPPDFQPIDVFILSPFANPYSPGVSPFTPPLKFPLAFAPGVTLTWTARDFKLPYIQQWNLTTQRQLTPTLALEVAYVGDKGTRIQGGYDPNQPFWEPGASSRNVQSRRPLGPILGNITAISSQFDSTYNGLQTTLTKRLGHGLTFQAAYTFAKAIDDTSTPTGFYDIPGQVAQPQSSTDLKLEKGLSAYDLKNRFVASALYELPFFRGSENRVVSHVLGGWRLNGIFTAQSGLPFTVYDSGDPNATTEGGGSARPNVLVNPNLPTGQRTPDHWFNTAAFQRATPGQEMIPGVTEGTLGTEGRNGLFSGGIINLDMGLAKDFKVTEAKNIEFRWEVFNVFNHPDFGIPVNDFNSPNFGQVQTTSLAGREMQFALKFLF
ncbi:MAG TPA: TonB-dependent receptor [Blastocatellia bacterium]